MKFTRKFLRRSRKPEKDIRAQVDEHNSGAGIKVSSHHKGTLGYKLVFFFRLFGVSVNLVVAVIVVVVLAADILNIIWKRN